MDRVCNPEGSVKLQGFPTDSKYINTWLVANCMNLYKSTKKNVMCYTDRMHRLRKIIYLGIVLDRKDSLKISEQGNSPCAEHPYCFSGKQDFGYVSVNPQITNYIRITLTPCCWCLIWAGPPSRDLDIMYRLSIHDFPWAKQIYHLNVLVCGSSVPLLLNKIHSTSWQAWHHYWNLTECCWTWYWDHFDLNTECYWICFKQRFQRLVSLNTRLSPDWSHSIKI